MKGGQFENGDNRIILLPIDINYYYLLLHESHVRQNEEGVSAAAQYCVEKEQLGYQRLASGGGTREDVVTS